MPNLAVHGSILQSLLSGATTRVPRNIANIGQVSKIGCWKFALCLDGRNIYGIGDEADTLIAKSAFHTRQCLRVENNHMRT